MRVRDPYKKRRSPIRGFTQPHCNTPQQMVGKGGLLQPQAFSIGTLTAGQSRQISQIAAANRRLCDEKLRLRGRKLCVRFVPVVCRVANAAEGQDHAQENFFRNIPPFSTASRLCQLPI